MTNPEQLAIWKENRRKWVDALRSGEYERCTRLLFDGKGHCCIGVLCRVAGLEPASDGRWGFLFAGCKMTAPKAAMDFVGLVDENGTFEGTIEWLPASLTTLNDDGSTFSAIADFIESEPKGLFRESMEDRS